MVARAHSVARFACRHAHTATQQQQGRKNGIYSAGVEKGIRRNPISSKHSNPSAPLPLPYYPRACLCRSIDRSPLHQASGPVPPVHSLAHADTHLLWRRRGTSLLISFFSLSSGDAASHTHILPTPLDGWPELLFLSL